jgi:hypothetical protein
MTAFDVALVVLVVAVSCGFGSVKLHKDHKRQHQEQVIRG